MEEKTSRWMILWFFLILFSVSAVMLGWLLLPFISVIVLGAVVTHVFRPIYNVIARKTQPSTASLLTCVVIFFILFIPTIFFVGVLSKEAYGLYLMGKDAVFSDHIRTLIENNRALDRANTLLASVNVQITGEELNKALSELGKIVGLFLYKQASAIASNVFKFIVYFFFMLIIIFYLFVDGEKLIAFIQELSPLPEDQDEKLLSKFNDMAGAILIGNGLCGLLQGAAGGLAFFLFGLNSAFLWGVIMGLLAFLPIIGIGVVLIPTAGYLMLKGKLAVGIFFLVFYGLLSGGVEYLLKPKLVGKRVKMHTLLVFLSIIGGLKLFGILGIIYGPLIVTAFLTLTDIYYASYREMVEPGKGRNNNLTRS